MDQADGLVAGSAKTIKFTQYLQYEAEVRKMPIAILEKEIDALIRKGIYKDRGSLFNDAMRVFFAYRPELKVESAVELYASGEYSLWVCKEMDAQCSLSGN